MQNTLKFTLGMLTLALAGNTHAASTSADVGITATVAANCNLTGIFADNVDVSSQIAPDGTVNTTNYNTKLPITTGVIQCTTMPAWAKLSMSSKNKGIMNGSTILPYTISGTFGDTATCNTASPPVCTADDKPITITDFVSGIGPYTDLLQGGARTPAGTPALTILLNEQIAGTAIAGSYTDTLTLTVLTSP